ncbi:MAG: wax ester/triacylglycerol synthase family O-acyltransferase [Conexibacter sp.]|nr:wax ester/triacylglycerol synthase family O-acyltransferase [Conexibacter sp.]
MVLAGACSGLRALLLARGDDLPAEGLRAMVPMNVRDGDDSLGDHVSSLFVSLPDAEADPLVRFAQIRATTAALKRSNQPLGAASLLQLSELAPPAVHHLLAPSLSDRRVFNMTITNVPGPPERLTTLGAPLESVWPLVPIAADHAVALAIVSYAGQLVYGICADRDTVPDVDVLAAGIVAGLADLAQRTLGSAA